MALKMQFKAYSMKMRRDMGKISLCSVCLLCFYALAVWIVCKYLSFLQNLFFRKCYVGNG